MKKKKHRSGRQTRRSSGRVRKPTPSSVAAQDTIDRDGARIETLLIQAVEPLSYDVVELKLDGRRHLRVTIDKIPSGDLPDGPYRSGVTIADCQLVSRAITQILADQGRDPGGFQIEVNSPGLDRPLTRTEHFERFRGQQVTVTLREARVDGRRNFTGTLVGADEAMVTVHVLDHDDPEAFPRSDIRYVKLRPEFHLSDPALPKRPKMAKGGKRRKKRG